jgi:methylglyoxal synthase
MRTVPEQKRIALVAHDARKPALVAWATAHKEALAKHVLFGTGTTGKLIEATTGLPVTKLLSGPIGGDQQIGAMIAEQRLDALIFFWDPLTSQPHDPDVKALIRLAVLWNIPMACNSVAADYLFTSPMMTESYTLFGQD